MVCRDFILPEPASYVFFYAIFNLRNLLYIIETRLQIAEMPGKSEKYRFPRQLLQLSKQVVYSC